ncbi:MAG: 5'-nucleotidase C-terminal domain-containing protein [Pseudomonadota bacterium]
MPKILTRLTIAVAALTASTAVALADFELNVLHFGDFHSRIEPINRFDSTCAEEDDKEGKCFGGIARMKTLIDQKRGELDNLLVLSAGDHFQGSLFYTVYKGQAEAEFMDQLSIDVSMLGNHEFDDGDQVLAEFLDKTTFPTIHGNVLIGANSPLAGKMPEYLIKEVGDEKIAIIGALATDTAETSSPSDAVLFMDPILYLNDVVERVKAEGATKIIALTHVGFEQDKLIARQVDGIDVIVGGHTNTFLSNQDDSAKGPYPVLETGPSGAKVVVVHAYAHSKYLGELNIVWDDNGAIKTASGDPILIDSKITPDPTMVARIKELAEPIAKQMEQVVGSAAATIDGNRESCRARECEMGNLVTDAMLDRVADQGITIAIQNGGGLRASIDQGDISLGEVMTVLPFQNTMSTFKLKGSDVVVALENGVSQVQDGGGRFPQVAGLKYSFDMSLPPGDRTSDVMVDNNGQFEPIDLNAMYGVVSNNFMRAGGDGYTVFAVEGQEAYDYGPLLEEVVIAYLGKNTPYQPFVGDRITEIKATPGDSSDDSASTGSESAEGTIAEEVKELEEVASDATTHVIAAGDNLWNLARRYFGDATRWGEIAEANPDKNPSNLTVGQELSIPSQSQN